MSDEHERLEAMVVALRDQLDAMTERLEQRLADQTRQLHRLHASVVELECTLREDALEEPPRSPGGVALVT